MKKSELFELLEPPPGGLTRLRARLDEGRRPVWRPLLAMAYAVAIVVAGTLTSSRPPPPVDLFGAVRASPAASVAMGLETPGEPVAITGGEAALQRRPSSNPQVLMYRLAVLEASAAE